MKNLSLSALRGVLRQALDRGPRRSLPSSRTRGPATEGGDGQAGWKALTEWLNRQPRRVVVGSGLAALFLVWVLYAPMFVSIREAGQRLRGLQEEVRQMRQAWEEVRAGAVRDLPGREAVPELIKRLHDRARALEVEILTVAPGNASPQNPSLEILPLELQMEGEYESLGRFLGAIRQDRQLGVVTVRRFRIGREERLLPRLRVQMTMALALKSEGR